MLLAVFKLLLPPQFTSYPKLADAPASRWVVHVPN